MHNVKNIKHRIYSFVVTVPRVRHTSLMFLVISNHISCLLRYLSVCVSPSLFLSWVFQWFYSSLNLCLLVTWPQSSDWLFFNGFHCIATSLQTSSYIYFTAWTYLSGTSSFCTIYFMFKPHTHRMTLTLYNTVILFFPLSYLSTF